MSEVKWIKICTDIFDDEKILLIESMPEADSIIVCWFKLLTLAGKMNNSGVFMLNDRIAYTDEMLASVFRRPLNTVRMALQTFEQFGMVELINNVVTIPNWEKHQSEDRLTKLREYQKEYQKGYRKKQQEIAENSKRKIDSKVYVNKEDIDSTDSIEKEDLTVPNGTVCRTKDVRRVLQAWNSLPDIPHIVKIDPESKRGSMLRSRINSYGVDSILQAIENIRNSSFLRGQNKNSFQITFDWFIKPNNFVKVLEGNYTDKGKINLKDKTSNIFLQVAGEENEQAANNNDISNS